MSEPIKVKSIVVTERQEIEETWTYESLLELFDDNDGSVVAPLIRRCQEYESQLETADSRTTALQADNERLRAYCVEQERYAMEQAKQHSFFEDVGRAQAFRDVLRKMNEPITKGDR